MCSILVQWEGADCSNVVGVVVSLMTVCVTRRDSACCQLLIVTLSPIIIPVLYSILVQWEGVDCSNVVSLMAVCHEEGFGLLSATDCDTVTSLTPVNKAFCESFCTHQS